MPLKSLNKQSTESLLLKFNNRDRVSFGDMYTMLFKEIYYFHSRIYNNNYICTEDLIQDIFLKIWIDTRLKFDSISKLKSYIYRSIANSYINDYNRLKKSSEILNKSLDDEDWWVCYAVEAEIFSIVPEALGMLPKDCAESFQLFIEGYSVKEISEMLNKPTTTIYSQKEKAISILRKKISKDKIFALLIYLGTI